MNERSVEWAGGPNTLCSNSKRKIHKSPAVQHFWWLLLSVVVPYTIQHVQRLASFADLFMNSTFWASKCPHFDRHSKCGRIELVSLKIVIELGYTLSSFSRQAI